MYQSCVITYDHVNNNAEMNNGVKTPSNNIIDLHSQLAVSNVIVRDDTT